ncbi:hypothetical protein VNO78_00139 [Psophocarpus tetragonolobus]|uniref:Uncharacterized protein n=1 Tax=Psophocarpus tetragonolobus TaxID=3891 RepID=A0AAN9SWU9_PSOTE
MVLSLKIQMHHQLVPSPHLNACEDLSNTYAYSSASISESTDARPLRIQRSPAYLKDYALTTSVTQTEPKTLKTNFDPKWMASVPENFKPYTPIAHGPFHVYLIQILCW